MKTGNRKGTRNYAADFKRRLALAACEPGVSVSKLAQEHQINANMLFKWRRDLRAGVLDAETDAPATLLPVTLTATPMGMTASMPARATGAATIEIVIADAIVRVPAGVDRSLLKAVIVSLRP